MTPRDLYFDCYHQAAHVVVALVLGCRVEYVEIGTGADKIGWNLDAACVQDVEAVCAAGFEMEQILRRREDLSWSRAEGDRGLLQVTYADRTGLSLTTEELAARFTAGAVSSRSVLGHAGARHAIDELADYLNDAYLRDERRVEANDLKAITSQITGVPARP